MLSINYPIILSLLKNYCENSKNNNVFTTLKLLGYYTIFFQRFKNNISTIDEYNQSYIKMKEVISSRFNSDLIFLDFQDVTDLFNILNKLKNLEYLLIKIIDYISLTDKILLKNSNLHLLNQQLIRYMLTLSFHNTSLKDSILCVDNKSKSTSPKASNLQIDNKSKSSSLKASNLQGGSLTKILNLFSSYGGFINYLIKNKSNNIHCYENDDELIQISLINRYIISGTLSEENSSLEEMISVKKGNIIFDNLINETYDLILCDFPVGIRNIIHANCCEKIKELKIRGTKAEPLILQLIMISLNKNGRAVINVPNTLLNNDSTQHIETRKYLINNFNVKKIVTVDQDLQFNKEYKTSIIYFEKSNTTKEISFCKLEVKDDKEVETEICKVDYKKLESKNFNLYYEKYNEDSIDNSSIKYEKMGLLVDVIYDNNENISNLNNNFLKIPTYLNNNKIEQSFENFNLSKDEFTLSVKDSNKCLQEYFNYYFQKIITPKINTYTKGKLLKIDIDELFNVPILIPSINTQIIIINYSNINNKLIEKNNEQIVLYEKLKSDYLKIFLESVEKLQHVELKTLCKIDTSTETNNTIIIQRNSIQAGKISLSLEKLSNTNMYFLNNLNENINNKYLYYFLKENENKLNKLAKMTVTINLSRTNLETFNIPIMDKSLQENIISQLDYYETIIKQLLEVNNFILSKNIIKEVINLDDKNIKLHL